MSSMPTQPLRARPTLPGHQLEFGLDQPLPLDSGAALAPCARSAPGSRPNIHFCAILDFVNLCRALDIEIERSLSINPKGTKNNLRAHRLANFFGEQGMFLLRKR
jgi:hypothetical protein